MPRIFLDTSIQIQRVLGSTAFIQNVSRHLAQDQVIAISSHYVLMEYQRSIIADFAHVQRQFATAKSLRDALIRISTGQYSFRTRSLTRCIQIAGLALGEQSIASLTVAQDILDIYLQSTLLDYFFHHVTLLPDPINCDLINIGINHQTDNTYTVANTCRKETATCTLPDFLENHKAKLQAISDYLVAHPKAIKGQTRVERLLTSILADPRTVLGQNACWPLGDIIIALQIPDDALLWTHDPDFDALAEALGLTLYAPQLGGD